MQSKAPNALIICSTPFYPLPEKTVATIAACRELDIFCADISDLNTVENKSFIGAEVYDAAGNVHIVDHPGVANHPGDLGMRKKAERMISVLGL